MSTNLKGVLAIIGSALMAFVMWIALAVTWQRSKVEPCQCKQLLQMIQRANRRIAVLEANQRQPLPPCDLQGFEFQPEDYR